MIKILVIFTAFFSIISVYSCKKTAQVETPVIERKVEAAPMKDTVAKQEIKTGWEDSDTYTVMVIDESEEKAINKARLRILKDIINVRFKLYGKYSQIALIKDEFEQPLKNGKVINRKEENGKVKIYYQVRHRDLKTMFEKK